MTISSYSTTASSNTSVNGVSVAEGMAPSDVNNAIREIMADLASYYSVAGTKFTAQADVRGNGTQALRVISDNGGTASLSLTSTGNAGWTLGSVSGSALTLSQDGTERLRWISGGTILIGKTGSSTTTSGIELGGGSDGGASFTNTGSYIVLNKNGSGTVFQQFRYSNVEVGSITTNGSSTSFNTSSARALKIDDGPVADPIALLMAVEPRMARFESAPDEPSCPMFFADELAAVNPWSATEDSADYGKQTAILWAVCRQQQAMIEALSARLDAAGL